MLLWLPAGVVATTVFRFGANGGPAAEPGMRLAAVPMMVGSLVPVAPCGLPLALGCWRLWRLGYRRGAWMAGIGLGAVTVAASLVAGLREPMADVDSTLSNSKRFQKFRNYLIRDIPRIPNDRASLSALQSKGNSELLRIYMCWKLRRVAIRPRRVTGQFALQADCRSTAVKPNTRRSFERWRLAPT